jgi:hypothetical protein
MGRKLGSDVMIFVKCIDFRDRAFVGIANQKHKIRAFVSEFGPTFVGTDG